MGETSALCHRCAMATGRRAAGDDAVEWSSALDGLLREREALLSSLDKVVALKGTARLVRESIGMDCAYVAERELDKPAVIRWTSGNRSDALQGVVVPIGRGLGGRVLAVGGPVKVTDYVSAQSITHHFDAQVRTEGLAAMVAVPIVDRHGPTPTILAIAYGALRHPGEIGDDAITKLQLIADNAASALRIAEAAQSTMDNGIAAERKRMQDALHDSVGALLFSIGAQVRDLHQSTRDNPALEQRLRSLEADVSAASSALGESLLALAESSPERALPVEIAEHCRSFENRRGVPARFVQLGQVPQLDGERTALLVAAVREGLLNVEKHARAHTVVVSIGTSEGGVQVVVADDGSASAEPVDSPGCGMGLTSLARRAERLGGRVSLVRDEEEGCVLRTWVPVLVLR
jgi:signal transduction histidine kinase